VLNQQNLFLFLLNQHNLQIYKREEISPITHTQVAATAGTRRWWVKEKVSTTIDMYNRTAI
jgi:hypothetical protein